MSGHHVLSGSGLFLLVAGVLAGVVFSQTRSRPTAACLLLFSWPALTGEQVLRDIPVPYGANAV